MSENAYNQDMNLTYTNTKSLKRNSLKMATKRLNAWQKKVDQYHKEGNHDFCPLAWECKKK